MSIAAAASAPTSAPVASPSTIPSPDGVPVLHLDLSSTFGVVFWAFVVSTTLFGVSVVQGYFYYMHNEDRRSLKAFVAFMILLDFTTTALSSEALYDYLIVNFGNPLALLYMTKPYISEYVITAVVTLCSQLFYASRIKIVAKDTNLYGIPYVIVFLGLAAFGLALAATQEIYHNDRLISGLEKQKMLILAGMNTGTAAACDILATIAMCIFLGKQKTMFRKTKRIVMFLLFFTINRGVLVALAQIGFLTAYVAAPSKIYWMPFHLSISKLHVNTLLAMLNSRLSLRDRTAGDYTTTPVNFSKECTFNSLDVEVNLPSKSSRMGSFSFRSGHSRSAPGRPQAARLRLSQTGTSHEMKDIHKSEKSPVSASTIDSPLSKLSATTFDETHEIPVTVFHKSYEEKNETESYNSAAAI